jgi:two-component system chemotaxis sensor kinase CheA
MNRLPDELFRELLSTFQNEAKERLESANKAMLALEEEQDAERVRGLVADLFREVHSLKGASGALGLTEIQELSHRLETLFERARGGALLPREHHDLIYRALDAIAALVAGTYEAGKGPETAGVRAALDAAAAVRPPAPKPVESKALAEPQPGAPETISKPEPAARISDETVRVATSKLDSLMGQVGELIVAVRASAQRAEEVGDLHADVVAWEKKWREARPRYSKIMADLSLANGSGISLSAESAAELRRLLAFVHDTDSHGQVLARCIADVRHRAGSDVWRMDRVVGGLQDQVRRTRMMPVSAVLSLFPRMVRDLARSLGKEVSLEILGGEIEADRSVLEQLKDPISHLIRNAVDHGIEAPEDRIRKGKARRGLIRMSASQKGDSIELVVSDDGAGMDVRRVRTVAARKGVVTAELAEAMPEREAMDLVFRSGFSTSPLITDISGRGVGLDVVRDRVERLNGLIEVTSELGRRTSFAITVPLSIATTQCLFVRVGSDVCALPVTNVSRIMRIEPHELGRAGGRDMVLIDERPIPLVRFADVLGVDGDEPDGDGARDVVVLGSAENRIAFAVEGLEGAEEVVIKALPEPFQRVRFVAGAAITGAGDVVVIINVGDLTRAAEGGVVPVGQRRSRDRQKLAVRPVVLIADDSIVTRTLEKNVLESAGYDVLVASDGGEAWNALETNRVDVLVSDVEMPLLDGFALTEKVRNEDRFRTLPVVLVTSLDSREYRERGIAAGADAYIVKHAFNQEHLLDTIRSLI